MTLTKTYLEELLREVSRAPTADNTQPSRWQVAEDEVVQFLVEARRLKLTDPDGVHTRQSMGSSFEGMSIALSRRGRRLSSPTLLEPAEGSAGLVPYARASLADGAEIDPLADQVCKRRTYRGRFEAGDPGPISEFFADAGDVTIVSERDTIRELASHYDSAVAALFSRPGYAREMYGWMRFRRSHADWNRDGLRADCMDLSGLEAYTASILMRPAVFKVLSWLGLGRAILSEAAKIRSSTVVALFCPSTDADWFDIGRRFYRFCLEVTSLGYSLCPLSSLADDPDHARAVGQLCGVEARLANAFRIGPQPREGVPESPRLPVPELLV